MLNSANERELAYVVLIDAITPIEGYDRVELAHVGGWTVVVGKGEFKAGDPAIYFEIDSQLPEVEPFVNMEFLTKKKYKIKAQKMCKSLSFGLLMSATNFGWTIYHDEFEEDTYIIDKENRSHSTKDESRFLTKQLGVIYAVAEDNARKANSEDKYKKMARRHPKLFSKQPFRWLMRRNWGRKLLFFLFGKKKDKKTGWPQWVTKTDEERIENMTYLLKDKSAKWIATEKIDGTSTTFTLKRGRWNSSTMRTLLEKGHYNIPCVPILNESYVLPDTVEELRTYVDSKPSMIDGDMREGIVFRSQDGTQSFKCVSPEYLLKYHQ